MKSSQSGRRTGDLALCGLFSALLAVSAWVTVPGAVPFTLQTFAVFAAVELLGAKRALLSVTVYILLGAFGLPVFSGFQGGIGVLFGATGGYILGFFAIPLCGILLSRLTGDGLAVRVAACLAGLMLCYAAGTLWFLRVYMAAGKSVTALSVLGMCVFPFVLPDFCKLAAATLLAFRLERHTPFVNKK